MANATTHKFTESGLGAAPFRFLGVQENSWGPAPGVSTRAGGSCAHCGTSIRWEHIVVSADGVQSAVGSSCIRLTGDAGLVDAVKAAKRDEKAAQRMALQQARFAAAQAAQRDVNGGLTDAELAQLRADDAAAQRLAADECRAKLFRPIADIIDGPSPFRASVAAGLRGGQAPAGRGAAIVAEIVAKKSGPKNSPEFKTEFDRVLSMLHAN